MKTISKGPFLGINNRLPDFALSVRTRQVQGDYLRAADNVDIDNSGSIVRRRAAALLYQTAGAHSLYLVSETVGYLVRDSVLYRVGFPVYSENSFAPLTSNAPVSYAEFAGSLYYSNGTDSGRITGGVWFPMALPTPATPTTSVIPGTLAAGTYQIAVSHYNSVTREEGGVSASCNPTLAATGGFRVALPAQTPGADKVIVYISTLNGSIPMLHTSVVAGTAYLDVTTLATGREATQRYEAPLPAGTQLFMFNGCLCSVNGASVYEGSPFRPGYYLPSEGRVPFPANVSNAVPAQNGIYIVADKTYWIPGTRITTGEDVIQQVLPYGGVRGTSFITPSKTQVGWFGQHGIVLADTHGEVNAVMYENIAITPPASGTSALFSDRGYLRVVSCGWCLNLENLATTSYSDYDFTSMSGGYGTKADGVYALVSTGNVWATIDLGKEDFGTEELKHLPAVYLGVTAETPMTLRVQTPQHDYAYDARSSGTELRVQRVDTGRGLRSNWYNFTLTNSEGSDFTLATVSFSPVASTRRI